MFADDRTPLVTQIQAASYWTEALALVGARDDARRLYQPLLNARDRGLLLQPSGLTEGLLGIAAACGADWDRSEAHFETALQQATDMPHRVAQPEVRRWYAWMLMDRDAPGDREKAQSLLGEAIEMYRAIGMPKHVEMAERMLNPQSQL